MTNKELAIEAIQNLPETLTLEEIVDELVLLAAIRKGEEAADAGRVISHEDVKRAVASWTIR